MEGWLSSASSTQVPCHTPVEPGLQARAHLSLPAAHADGPHPGTQMSSGCSGRGRKGRRVYENASFSIPGAPCLPPKAAALSPCRGPCRGPVMTEPRSPTAEFRTWALDLGPTAPTAALTIVQIIICGVWIHAPHPPTHNPVGLAFHEDPSLSQSL